MTKCQKELKMENSQESGGNVIMEQMKNHKLDAEERKIFESIKIVKQMNVLYASFGDDRTKALQTSLHCMRKFMPEVAKYDHSINRFICPSCGNRIKLRRNDSMKFCGDCGQKLIYEGIDE